MEVNMFHPQGNFGAANGIPFANTMYGYAQPTPFFQPPIFQGVPQSSWQYPAQQQAQLQAALQQQAMLQLFAPQLAAQPFAQLPAQPFAPQNSPGTNALNGLANGATQSVGGWQQPQLNAEQINPALQHQSQQLLQRLAQHHHLMAQQLAQLAAQQSAQISGYPYTGQFIPGQLGANFLPGITMH
jgi:hypothetical protein